MQFSTHHPQCHGEQNDFPWRDELQGARLPRLPIPCPWRLCRPTPGVGLASRARIPACPGSGAPGRLHQDLLPTSVPRAWRGVRRAGREGSRLGITPGSAAMWGGSPCPPQPCQRLHRLLPPFPVALWGFISPRPSLCIPATMQRAHLRCKPAACSGK